MVEQGSCKQRCPANPHSVRADTSWQRTTLPTFACNHLRSKVVGGANKGVCPHTLAGVHTDARAAAGGGARYGAAAGGSVAGPAAAARGWHVNDLIRRRRPQQQQPNKHMHVADRASQLRSTACAVGVLPQGHVPTSLPVSCSCQHTHAHESVCRRTLLIPKSPSFSRPWPVRNTLLVLMSLCRMPIACTCASAATSCTK